MDIFRFSDKFSSFRTYYPKKIIDYVNSIMSEWSSINYAIKSVDVTDRQPFSEAIAA